MSSEHNSADIHNRKIINTKDDLKNFLEYERNIYGMKNIRMPLICISERYYLWRYIVILRHAEYYYNSGKK